MAERPDSSHELLTESEVQRRVARATAPLHNDISELRAIVAQCRNDLTRQHSIISRLVSEPLAFGNLVLVQNEIDVSKFRDNDEILVVDSNSPHYLKSGQVQSCGPRAVNDEGEVVVKLSDGVEAKFAVGAPGKAPAQVRLAQKDDGTFAVVNLDGKPWEIRGVPDLGLRVGDTVKVKPDTKAIVGRGYEIGSGPICQVVALIDNSVEVMHKGDKFLLHNPNNLNLEEGDRAVCDPGMFSVIKKLPRDARSRYKITSDLTMTWDDIGGLDFAKQQLRDALELPFQHPELFAHYGIEPFRGILLYGPPGCGKTLMARVSAWAVANLHGKKASDTGYVYVKSPEILDKWVGNTEAEIRELFERCRKHYRDHGYKAILVFDEADAIMPQRGSRVTSSISDTMVPMFLGEMDGIDKKQTDENPIVMLMTNRADTLDPAITRPGRISRKIKIERPNETTAMNILEIHTANMPFADSTNKSVTLTVAIADLFSKTKLLYRINNEHDFTLGDCVNGAMLEGLAQSARMIAMHRDLESKTRSGVRLEDFREAAKQLFREQVGLNHSYDISDFCDRIGIQAQNAQVTRCFGAA
jgi:proteasome-associated ATPase